MSNMEIPKGYKQTELGIIPVDWEVESLGENAYITKLAGFEYSNYFNSYKNGGEIIVIRGTNITHNLLDLTDVRYIPKTTSDKLPRSQLKKNDLVFAYVGTIGPVYLIKEDNKFHLGPNTCKISVENTLSSKFIFNYFKSFLIKNEISKQISIGAQPSLSMTKIRNFKLILSNNIKEQEAIANVLSNTDELIQSLEKLIEKKKNIKEGTMQQLLTGKKKLEGFNEEWEVKKIKDLLDFEQPVNYIVNNTEYSTNGKTPVLTANKSFILGYTEEDFGIFQNLPVIIFDDFTLLNKYVDFPFKVKSSALKILKLKDSNSILRFIFEVMQTINLQIGDHKRYYISEYSNIEIKVPPKPEQKAIANILSDMDNEITTLKQKLNKYQQIKEGMMQQLLTGKIRLV